MLGFVRKIIGKLLIIRLDDDVNLDQLLKYHQRGKKIRVEVNASDERQITPDQRKKIFALINDFCDYTGDIPKDAEEYFKARTQMSFGIEYFHLSSCSVTVANYMILTILDYLFEENIPFKLKTWESIPNEFPKQVLAMKTQTCVICGRPHADLAHYRAVGMGRNRHTIDERKMYFMSLCREHHTEQHKIGINTFIKLHHIKPIKLSDGDLIRFHILTKQRLKELQENDKSNSINRAANS